MATSVKLPNGYTHMRLLGELLAFTHEGPSKTRELVDKNDIYSQLGHVDEDGKTNSYRELLLSTSLESSTLMQTEIKQTIIEGAEPMKCVRNAFPIIPMRTKTMQINIGETGTYADIVAEGAEIPIDTQDYSSVTFTAKKYGVRPVITKELVNDSEFGIIAMEVSKAGQRLENSLNRAVVNEFINTNAATAACCTDFGNAGATPLLHLDEAVTTLKNSGYIPTRVLMHPTCTAAYREAIRGLYFDGMGSQVLSTGSLGRLHGLDVYETGIADSAATYVWGWGTDNYIGGIVYDVNAALAIGMRQDIEVEQYKDPIRDLVGMSCTMRFDAQCLSASASNLLQY